VPTTASIVGSKEGGGVEIMVQVERRVEHITVGGSESWDNEDEIYRDDEFCEDKSDKTNCFLLSNFKFHLFSRDRDSNTRRLRT
jgi:hypothetical protein